MCLSDRACDVVHVYDAELNIRNFCASKKSIMNAFFFLYSTLIILKLCVAISKHPIILTVAFDGFRHDYLKRGLTPILQNIADNGTAAPYMLNQFPTITFPNFHSISTGMHPETHGVLGNRVFNEKRQCIDYSYELFHYNDEIVPLWNLNEFTGDQRYSGVMMWPGEQYAFQNRRPTFHVDFNEKVDWNLKVDKVIGWILNETTPANLVYLYFEQPDEDGHHFGPDSPQVNQQLRRINAIVEYLLQRLTENAIRDKVNLFFLADHGMAPILTEKVIDLERYLDSNAYTLCGSSPGLQVLPNEGFEEQVYKNLTAASELLKNFKVYKPNEIPDRWYYKNNKRNIGFFLESDLNYVFQDAKTLKGDHGYDNKEKIMYPIFFATGPLIKSNYQIKPFSNIDLFPLFSFMLGLNPLPAHLAPNGTLDNVKSMLRESKNHMKKYEYRVDM